jgi:4-hydroxy-4-methyl-2-oxoglutarate aldolase
VPIVIGPAPAPLPVELVEKVRRVSLPTLGHYLEEGFADPGIARQCGTGLVVGRALTVRLTAQDSTLLHHAAGLVEPGDVVVVDMGGDVRHAPVGEVLAVAIAARGGVAVVVDGVVTDVDEIEREQLPAYARGRSALTTKLLGVDAGGVHVPVNVGGVTVQPGDVVIADRNGVFAASPAVVAAIIDVALADDAEEPELVAALRAGARLGEETGATATVAELQAAAASL